MHKHYGTQFDLDGANVSILSGWLHIEQVLDFPLNGHSYQALRCVIMTRRPPANPRDLHQKHLTKGFPVILTGKPMEIILDWAKCSSSLPRVVIQGPLRVISEDGCLHTIIEAKYLDTLDVASGELAPMQEIVCE